MAVIMVLDVPGATQEQYDAVTNAVEARGAEVSKGRLYHVAGPKPGGWLVVDVWEDEQSFGRFGEVLGPLLAEAGLADARPQLYPVHNQIPG